MCVDIDEWFVTLLVSVSGLSVCVDIGEWFVTLRVSVSGLSLCGYW